MTTATFTTTLYPLLTRLQSSASSPSLATFEKTVATITQELTRNVSSSSNAAVTRSTQDAVQPDDTKSASSITIGLSIGLPVGLFCLGLLILLLCSYLGWFRKNRARQVQLEKHFTAQNPDGTLDGFMSSRIQYKVSKAANPGISTPGVPVYVNPFKTTSSLDIRKDVDTYLYSKPPNIHGFTSSMPSTSDLTKLSSSSNIVRQVLDQEPYTNLPDNSKDRKWAYQSPLSKWFLRNSTYLDDALTVPIPLKTPIFQLKQLKMLSRIQKDYADIGGAIANERSPILEKIGDSPQSLSKAASGESDSPAQQTAHNPLSAVYGSFDGNFKASPHEPNFTLDPKPQKKPKTSKRNRRRKLRRHLKQVTNVKPLPLTPKAIDQTDFLIVGEIYEVAENYKAKLLDEIDISKGELVKVLATHTDGWCLAERRSKGVSENANLTESSQSPNGQVSRLNDEGYLNSSRGIIPGSCLREI